ncbi:transcription factor rap1 [Trichoderma arundinaceum]|uniref:DNA-binding protein RAP1 n=1 Tax=Trichoderma arundinaceum TaxID=490622 RepID=A0A395P006_TRIAR|nr:transcription factor rap1 [Trichoderma arundinaceum]
MASHITYNGVSGDGGGNIFKDMKFWVSRRVPQRDSIVEKIQNNSGAVVLLEKDADMLIADHARKDAPPGSYSWKFITESVTAGIIQVEDRYLIGPPPSQARSIRTGPHAKKSRTPFTELDDAIVSKRVLERGIDTAGNKMYMELEDEYPHHPWQSWRNRWVKVLSLRSNEEIDRLARMANLDVDNAPITAKHIIRKHQREDWPGQPQPPQTSVAAGTSDQHSQRQHAPSPRVSTNEEARRQEVAVPENMDRKSTADEVASEPSGDATEEDTTIYHDVATGDEPATTEEADPGVEERRKVQKEEPNEVAGLSQVSQKESERGDDAEDDITVDGGLSSFTERDQFLSDLQDYCEANDKGLDVLCVIGDNEVDLWELFQAVSAQSLPPEELDWKQVAEDVGLGWVQNKEVIAALLESSYKRYLAEFVEAMMSFEEHEADTDEDLEEGDETILEGGETATEPTTPRASQRSGIASSISNESGKARSRKRLPDTRPLTPAKLGKRRRTVHAEIPVTPENKGRATRRLSAPASAPGNLQHARSREQTETEDPRQKTPWRDRQRESPEESAEEPAEEPAEELVEELAEEPADMTPSQQLRSETESVASPEAIEPGTPTLYYSPTAASRYHWNDRHLDTIQEEESPASTPTRPRSKKRALPASFQRSGAAQLLERRERRRLQEEDRRRLLQRRQQERQQQWLEQQRQEERLREEQQRQEEQRERQQDQGTDQQQRQRWWQEEADSEIDEEVSERNQQEFQSWTAHYREEGYSEEMILEAMRRTTMTPGILMEVVLQSLQNGEGIPAYDEGIWTDRDDAHLRYIARIGNLELTLEDSANLRRRKEKAQKMLDRLLYKHTEPRVKLRRKFLRALAMAERANEMGQGEGQR